MIEAYSQKVETAVPINEVKTIPLFGVGVSVKIKTLIMDSKTGKCVKDNPWQKNLVMDTMLNNLANPGGSNPTQMATSFTHCKVGSGTTPTSTASGAVTGSQAGTGTVTSSAGFFTAGMVGMLLKWGTGSAGVETYITAFTNSTTVTVDVVGTHSGEVFTVWAVNQTALATQLFVTNTYQTNPGDCGTTLSNNQAIMQRTYVVASQVSTYNVNEIGWFNSAGALGGASIHGRIVLGSTDVVTPSNFYVVVIQITATYTPATPTAVGNVGTNINVAGNAAIERLAIWRVATTGNTDTSTIGDVLGNGTAKAMMFATAVYTQNANPSETPKAVTSVSATRRDPITQTFSGTRGVLNITSNTSSTTAGQSLFGICLTETTGTANSYFDILFTTPQTAPSGTFQPNTVWTITFDRQLVN